ncbi:MAG: TraR/DksA family transcriptional regulator [Pseudomonadota bacterium]
MQTEALESMRRTLELRKSELSERLGRIKANVRRGYHADSKERAKEMEDAEVVDALGNETRREIAMISSALQRMEAGDYGICIECGSVIADERLQAQPFASVCIDCARFEEKHARLNA